jgi:hypothetical protein
MCLVIVDVSDNIVSAFLDEGNQAGQNITLVSTFWMHFNETVLKEAYLFDFFIYFI